MLKNKTKSRTIGYTYLDDQTLTARQRDLLVGGIYC